MSRMSRSGGGGINLYREALNTRSLLSKAYIQVVTATGIFKFRVRRTVVNCTQDKKCQISISPDRIATVPPNGARPNLYPTTPSDVRHVPSFTSTHVVFHSCQLHP